MQAHAATLRRRLGTPRPRRPPCPRTRPRSRSFLVDLILSLDGCAAAEGWPGWWGLQSAEYLAWLGEEPLPLPGTRLISTDAIEAVRELRRTADLPLAVNGSLSLGHALMAAGLVDRFRIILFPVITGRTGLERIWEGYQDFTLELLQARTFEGGLQLLEHRPTPLAAPPGTAWER